jgi:hypothetical protein
LERRGEKIGKGVEGPTSKKNPMDPPKKNPGARPDYRYASIIGGRIFVL